MLLFGTAGMCLSQAHLVAMHHDVVCGDQGFENHYPAGVAGPLHQRVSHLGDVHTGLLGGLDQVWEAQWREGTRGQMMDINRTNRRESDRPFLVNLGSALYECWTSLIVFGFEGSNVCLKIYILTSSFKYPLVRSRFIFASKRSQFL